MVAFVAWRSSSEGNQAGAIAGKLAVVTYCYRVEAGSEIPTGAPVVKRALKGAEKAHVAGFLGNGAKGAYVGGAVVG